MDIPRDANWNERHIQRAERVLERGPNPLLSEHRELLPATGLALDAAAGLAQHGLYLARHGLRVIALDIAEAGLRLAVPLARREKLEFDAAVCDIELVRFPPEFFDVIVNMLFLNRTTLPVYRRSLKPGGLLFFEGLLREGAEAQSHYLRPGELQEAFAGFKILFEGGRILDNGDTGVRKQTCQLIARKPMV